MIQSSIFDSPCSIVSCRSPERSELSSIVDDENEILIDENSSIRAHEMEESIFLYNWIQRLRKNSNILVVKSGRSVRQTSTSEDYDNLRNVYVLNVQAHVDLPTSVLISKRQIYSNDTCQSLMIPIRTRVLNPSNSLLGFIFQRPSSEINDNRYLILYDDFTAAFHRQSTDFRLCLCQDFRRHLFNIEHNLLRVHYQHCFQEKSTSPSNRYQVNQTIQVKKFDGRYHLARIVDIDFCLLKICFFQRKSKKQIWIYENSASIIDQTFAPRMDESSTTIDESICLRKRKTTNDSSDKTKRNQTLNNIDHSEKQMNPVLSSDPPLLQRVDEQTRTSLLTNYYTQILLPKFRQLNALNFTVHKCGRECVLLAEENFSSTKVRGNPFLLPFECRWSIVDSVPRGYRTPCRRTLFSLDEIEHYLYRTESKLSIKFFVDGVLSRFQPLLDNFDRTYLLDDDLSHGKENVPIRVYNDVDNDRADNFTYITQIRPIDQRITTSFNDDSRTSCCDCKDNCADRMKCACFRKTLQQARLNRDSSIVEKDKNRIPDSVILKTTAYQRKRLLCTISSGIYECNSKCACHQEHCLNRLVQHGLFVQLQLFKDQQKGWGLRALHDIPCGTFICQYIGELLTSDQGHERALTIEDKYQTSLDLVKQIRDETDDPIDDEPYVIDGSIYSNLGRYFNHSCTPNMFIQNVFIDSHNLRFPSLALFTSTHVAAGQELTWDYNYELLADREVKCYCGSKNCRGRLL